VNVRFTAKYVYFVPFAIQTFGQVISVYFHTTVGSRRKAVGYE
jgi:hypothetical protein